MIQCCKPIGSEILAQGYQRTSMSRSTIILDEGLRMADGKPAEPKKTFAGDLALEKFTMTVFSTAEPEPVIRII